MLSIIIPTLNEAAGIGALLESLGTANDCEIIVVDGGSDDGTPAIVANYPAQLLRSEPSRGGQLDRGVSVANGEILWFLHADSKVSASHVAALLHAMQDSRKIGGNFKISFDGGDNFSQWLDVFYHRIRQHGFYYGDSGIFIRRNDLDRLGGLSRNALMEDYSLVRRMQKHSGETLYIETPQLISSSRRFYGRSKNNIIVGWLLIHMMYYLHLPNRWLVYIYNMRLFSRKKR